MNRISLAVELFKQNYSCAQSILIAFADEAGIDRNLAFKIGAGLGGGIGRKQYICGAINAGAIIIGLKHGNYLHDDINSKDLLSKMVGNFVDECQSKLGGTQCLELIKIDLGNEEMRDYASKSGFFDRVCNNAVEQTASILEKYLAKNLLE